MLSLILVTVALIVSACKSGNHRVLVCLSILIPSATHYVIFNDSVDFAYYGTAAVSSLIVITILNYLPRSPLSTDIQVVNLMFIFANFIGWGMYHAYIEPFWYNALILIIFVIEFARLMIHTKKDEAHGACNQFSFIRNNDGRRIVRDTR